MLAKRIIPCLDVKDGRVVKGIEFKGLRDAGDPVELAATYDRQGADELVYLDISASLEGRRTLVEVVRKTAAEVFIPLTVGGGIRDLEDIRNLLAAGADKVSINTAAVDNPDLIRQAAERFGSQCVVVAIDARRVPGQEGWEVVTHGGTKPRGLDVRAWAEKVTALGAGEILLTSMDMDGGKKGYDLALTAMVAREVSVPVIASGGAGSLEDIGRVLTEGQADAALAASIFHYQQYTVNDVKSYLRDLGVTVRFES